MYTDQASIVDNHPTQRSTIIGILTLLQCEKNSYHDCCRVIKLNDKVKMEILCRKKTATNHHKLKFQLIDLEASQFNLNNNNDVLPFCMFFANCIY